MYKNHASSVSKRFNYIVIATLRAILDGMYSEILYNGPDFQSNKDFVTYTYWWLSKFQVDETERKVKKINLEGNKDRDWQVIW